MILSPDIVTAAKRNGSRGPWVYVPPGGLNVNPDGVVDLLVGRTSPRAQHAARDLLRVMARRPGQVVAAPPRSPDDQEPHVTVGAARRYRVRVNGQGFVGNVTYVAGAATRRRGGDVAPWRAPGV